ncbi:hypothetical protein BJ742DRAFT_547781 [Cladochytrium replicatum]|nr:hypothetical protein BJ742DRAFT_547781 [Cladochytrium replicatum]
MNQMKMEQVELIEDGLAVGKSFCALLREGSIEDVHLLKQALDGLFDARMFAIRQQQQEASRQNAPKEVFAQLDEEEASAQLLSIHSLWSEVINIAALSEVGSDDLLLRYGGISRGRLVKYYQEYLATGGSIQILDYTSRHVLDVAFVTDALTFVEGQVNNPLHVVLSTIGLTSSGKSTLLQFVFNCAFKASAGTCTKGMYLMARVIHFDDHPIFVFVLDTEGLMAGDFAATVNRAPKLSDSIAKYPSFRSLFRMRSSSM